MQHPLDNPVWNALISGNTALALGNERVKYFDSQVSPFAAVPDLSEANLRELEILYPYDRPILLWSKKKLGIPDVWKVIDCIDGLQMVYDNEKRVETPGNEIVKLSAAHVPEMIELTKLTRPGPFGTRTIAFGNYEGIFSNGRLAAMTGRRFHCFDHVEISAVCTHPEHLGKGYAKQLLLSQAKQIQNEGCVPYLHVREDNARAIQVYEALGFTIRMKVCFYVLGKIG